MDQQKLQALSLQFQDEMNQAMAGFKSKGWEHYKKVLIVAGVLAGVGFLGLFKTTAAQLKTVKVKVNQLREISKHAVQYRDDKQKLFGIKDKFPTEAERKDFLFNLILTSAKAEGIAIDSISSQKEDERSDIPFVKLAIDVTGKGSFHQVGRWAARMEGSSRFVQIEMLSLSKVRDTATDVLPSGLTTAQVTVTTVIPKGVENL